MSNPEPNEPGREPDGGHLSFDKDKQAAWTPPEAYPQPPRPQQPAPRIDGGHYPPPAAPYGQAHYDNRPLHERTSGLSLAGFITAIGSVLLSLTFFFAFFGFIGAMTALVLSIIGLVRDVHGRRMKGRGFAIAGIIVSAVLMLLILVVFILLISYAVTHPGGSCSSSDYYCNRPGYAPSGSI